MVIIAFRLKLDELNGGSVRLFYGEIKLIIVEREFYNLEDLINTRWSSMQTEIKHSNGGLLKF